MKNQATFFVLLVLLISCGVTEEKRTAASVIIFDTDANNELDDQHALAYLLLNGNTFHVAGVTVNATKAGGDIDQQYAEAERVMRLCGYPNKLKLFKGANANFDSIAPTTGSKQFDGSEAVDFIIETAEQSSASVLLIAVGKLTNVALALKKAPAISGKLRVVWLGSNYPEPGEYNLVNDTSALNYVLKTPVQFEMVTVRYGKNSGSDAVKVTQDEINKRMPGLGPEIIIPVAGRHGGEFKTFGDYSVSLFQHIDYHGDPPSRALFDMVAVAIAKDASWGEEKQIPAPLYYDGGWHDNPSNDRTILLWENFRRDDILKDFFETLENYQQAEFVK